MMSDYGYVAKYINNPFKFNYYESKLLISSMKEDKKIPKRVKGTNYCFKEFKLKEAGFYAKKLKVDIDVFSSSFEIYNDDTRYGFESMYETKTKSFIDKDKNGIRRYNVFVEGINAKTKIKLCYGVRVYADGRIEVGQYIDGDLNDRCLTIYPNGTSLIGVYKKGIKNGKFIKQLKNKKIQHESYVNGVEDGVFSFPLNGDELKYIVCKFGKVIQY